MTLSSSQACHVAGRDVDSEAVRVSAVRARMEGAHSAPGNPAATAREAACDPCRAAPGPRPRARGELHAGGVPPVRIELRLSLVLPLVQQRQHLCCFAANWHEGRLSESV